MPLYHIATAVDWAERTDTYAPSGFEDEGFIHCSTAEQLDVVATAIFSGRDDLVLLTLDERALGDVVVYEDLYQAGEEFPHLYGPMPLSAILGVEPYSVP